MPRPKKIPPIADQELATAAIEASNQLWRGLRGVSKFDPIKNPFGHVQEARKSEPRKNEPKPNAARTRRLPEGMSPVTAYVRSLDGDYKTTQEVADELDVSAQLIRKLARQRVTQAPSYLAPFGQITVHLYTPEDVQALRDYLNLRRVVRRRDEQD